MLMRYSVEFNLVEHCNLRCHGCDHASPLLPKRFADVADFARDVRALAAVFHVAEFRMVGGEPLLHPRLQEFLTIAREARIADKIVLVTNGVLLHEMPPESWRSIDQLWLSVYPGVRTRLSPEEAQRRASEHGIEFRLVRVDAFMHALLNQRIEDKALVDRVFLSCKMAHVWSCHTIYEGRYYKCSPAPLAATRLGLAGIAFAEDPEDSVNLRENPNLAENLAAYLARMRPLAACAYCLGSGGPSLPHRQLNREGVAAWQNEDHRELIASLSMRAR